MQSNDKQVWWPISELSKMQLEGNQRNRLLHILLVFQSTTAKKYLVNTLTHTSIRVILSLTLYHPILRMVFWLWLEALTQSSLLNFGTTKHRGPTWSYRLADNSLDQNFHKVLTNKVFERVKSISHIGLYRLRSVKIYIFKAPQRQVDDAEQISNENSLILIKISGP